MDFHVALTTDDLVGYLRAQFNKSSKLRVALFFLQLAVAVPAAVSVVIPDNYHEALYVLAIFGALLLGLWWFVKGAYNRSRSAAQAARRAALLTGGLAEPLSPTEISNLRERFTVNTQKAKEFEKGDYYASDLPAGPGRLAEMLEESAMYSEHLQRMSSRVMLAVLWFFLIIFFVIAFCDYAVRRKGSLILSDAGIFGTNCIRDVVGRSRCVPGPQVGCKRDSRHTAATLDSGRQQIPHAGRAARDDGLQRRG
jgi:hypothetical protein